jgi:hypothetical protein
VADLKRKLMRYIRQYNKTPKTIKWIYRNTENRITTDSSVTVHPSYALDKVSRPFFSVARLTTLAVIV